MRFLRTLFQQPQDNRERRDAMEASFQADVDALLAHRGDPHLAVPAGVTSLNRERALRRPASRPVERAELAEVVSLDQWRRQPEALRASM